MDVVQLCLEELKALIDTIETFKGRPMHMPVALEFQYALNHLFAARRQNKNNELRLRHIEKASGHFHRSHLDWLKSHIFDIQNHLSEIKPEWAAFFGFWQGGIRQAELKTLGHQDRFHLFERYRDLLRAILPHDSRAGQNTVQPSYWAGLGESKPPGPATYKLYEEWTCLEARLAAVSGERCSDHIHIVIQSFLYKQLDNVLPRFIAILKLSLLRHLNEAYKSKAQNESAITAPSSDFDMFEQGAAGLGVSFNEATISKWKTCRDFDPNNLYDGLLNGKLRELIDNINEPFNFYDELLDKFISLMKSDITA